jgi:hypothetical protein
MELLSVPPLQLTLGNDLHPSLVEVPTYGLACSRLEGLTAVRRFLGTREEGRPELGWLDVEVEREDWSLDGPCLWWKGP